MKVIHPGKPGQAVVGTLTGRDRRITRTNIHKNARLTPQSRGLLVRRVDELGWPMAEVVPSACRPPCILRSCFERLGDAPDAADVAVVGKVANPYIVRDGPYIGP